MMQFRNTRVETLLWKKLKGNYIYEPCVIQRDNETPYFAYIVLNNKSLHVINWSLKLKPIECLLGLELILDIQTVTEAPSFILYGVYAEICQRLSLTYLSSPDHVTKIEFAFLHSRSQFATWLQYLWLNRLMACEIEEDTTNKRVSHVSMGADNCYDHVCDLMATKDRPIEISQKIRLWIEEVSDFRQLVWRNSAILDWLIAELKKKSEKKPDKAVPELLKCLKALIEVGVINYNNRSSSQLLVSNVSTIVQDILYNFINEEETLADCVDVIFSLSLTVTLEDDHHQLSCLPLYNIKSSTLLLTHWMAMAVLMMNRCVDLLQRDEINSSQAIVIFKSLYIVGRLTDNVEIRKVVQQQFQNDFKYFGCWLQFSNKIKTKLPFKRQFLIFLERLKTNLFDKIKFEIK